MTERHLMKKFARGKSLCHFHLKPKRKLMILELQVTVSTETLLKCQARPASRSSNSNNNNSSNQRFSSSSNNQVVRLETTIKDLQAFKISKSTPRPWHRVHPKRLLLALTLAPIWAPYKIYHHNMCWTKISYNLRSSSKQLRVWPRSRNRIFWNSIKTFNCRSCPRRASPFPALRFWNSCRIYTYISNAVSYSVRGLLCW